MRRQLRRHFADVGNRECFGGKADTQGTVDLEIEKHN
jgi:hypothetical protein